ncbi:MAG: PTS sugar transporter subunit IIA [Candidatus Cloacimonetes bacterium]|jgi:mannitol/fructose-specific phosphotransferase system IIA component (Ntr-type)|nr:PTS sugar transporter subunit IIA [Candidatus Cloacimonadota bacterium]MDD3144077.1 PTS sugar transporter subunit IIA [Candidatus Cloacimonadota bacterium]MDY0367773.1 PTS sugar transporter subunit IIA [Candidatus Syntrophosphaera sp.]HOY85190.1 PTS sugar transporter subunit IIA [Candidatus Syntrophosphaera sp.]HPH60424.1 PTS sugar transporter subunit IIA [Candidatus Syntrophosphaera sp.]
MAKKFLSKADAARKLKVSERVIQEMMNSKTFETKLVGKNLKIDEDSLNEWLENLNESDEKMLALKRVICHFEEYMRPENIFLDFEAENKFDAIRILSVKAKELKLVRDARWLYEVVVAREELISTAIGHGVALLHPRHLHPSKIKTPSILFGRSSVPVDFDAPDNKPVNIFFMLLLHNDKQHLFSLSYISKLIMNPEILAAFSTAASVEEIHNCLTVLPEQQNK